MSLEQKKLAEEQKSICFILMVFKEPFNSYYREIYTPAIIAAGLTPQRADEVFHPGPIIQDIWDGIANSPVLVADVTGRNPNVFYELGLAHALGKPVVLLTQSMDDVPFDLRHLRHIVYNPDSLDWANKLEKNLTKAIQETIQNPERSLALPITSMDRKRLSGGSKRDQLDPQIQDFIHKLESELPTDPESVVIKLKAEISDRVKDLFLSPPIGTVLMVPPEHASTAFKVFALGKAGVLSENEVRSTMQILSQSTKIERADSPNITPSKAKNILDAGKNVLYMLKMKGGELISS